MSQGLLVVFGCFRSKMETRLSALAGDGFQLRKNFGCKCIGSMRGEGARSELRTL
jgi:hypothetical protein